jgi:hypothetical protein
MKEAPVFGRNEVASQDGKLPSVLVSRETDPRRLSRGHLTHAPQYLPPVPRDGLPVRTTLQGLSLNRPLRDLNLPTRYQSARERPRHAPQRINHWASRIAVVNLGQQPVDKEMFAICENYEICLLVAAAQSAR